jgi:phenylalanyl-tRNA synthetase beta chain
VEYRLEPAEHPLFLQGRCGTVMIKEGSIGYIGEMRPEVLDRRQIAMPCAAFEINLNAVLRIMKK